MKLIDRLLETAVTKIPTNLHDNVVVFGSAPMVLHGVVPDVRKDLDLFVSDATFERLISAGITLDEAKPGVPRLQLAPDIEIFKTWIGVEFPDVHAASAPFARAKGLRVASLEHVLAFKLARQQQKDEEDITLLRQAIGARPLGSS